MNSNLDLSANKPPTAKIIGVGGAGASILEHMAGTSLGELPLAAVHTHARVLRHQVVPHKVLLGVNRTHGLGAGGDPELARVLAEGERARLEQLCEGASLVFIVAGMGGGTGSGAAPVAAAAAKRTGALVIAVVTMPFEFEGVRRMQQARMGAQTLRAAADAVICLPNQKICRVLEQEATILESFRRTNELLTQGIRGIWWMLTRPGLINVDFAYLSSALRGRHVESALAAAEAAGENRASAVAEQILGSPLLDEGQALTEADEILVSLTGGSDLAIAEINRLMEQLNRRAGSARLVLGTAVDPGMEGRISATLLATRHARSAAPEGEPADAPPRQGLKAPGDFDTSFFGPSETPRPPARFVAPPPEATPARTQELLEKQPRSKSKLKQGMLALEIVSRGRFEKSEPTIHHGADLDVPTYIRRGVPLN